MTTVRGDRNSRKFKVLKNAAQCTDGRIDGTSMVAGYLGQRSCPKAEVFYRVSGTLSSNSLGIRKKTNPPVHSTGYIYSKADGPAATRSLHNSIVNRVFGVEPPTINISTRSREANSQEAHNSINGYSIYLEEVGVAGSRSKKQSWLLTCTSHGGSVAADDPSAAQRSGRGPPSSTQVPETAPYRT